MRVTIRRIWPIMDVLLRWEENGVEGFLVARLEDFLDD